MKKTASIFTLIIVHLISPNTTNAQAPFPTIASPYTPGVGDAGLVGFINTLIQLAALAAGIFALINLILAGFYYMTANGEPKNVQLAMRKINFSLIGLFIIVSSFALAILVGAIFFGDPQYIINPTITAPS